MPRPNEQRDPTYALELLEQLIRCPSVTPDDADCQQLLAEHLEPLGFHCEPMRFGDVDNLWARRGDAKPLFCFAGHTDVVPPGPLDSWATSPFVPERKDGQLYGRGAADMKASLAAFVVAASRFVEAHPNHDGSIALLITSDEEGPARDGTKRVIEALDERDEKIDWCLVGEPSSSRELGDVMRIGRRGSLSGILTVHGTPGHVAYPQLADNPIIRFAPALHELAARRWDNGNERFPPTSFQIVKLISDSGAVNVIPGSLSARFNFRYSTEWDHHALQAEVERILTKHGLSYEVSWRLSGKPFLTPQGRLIDAAQAAVAAVTGKEAELSTGGGTSDGRFISPSGAAVVELGPINASIHKPNEHVALEDVLRLTEIYERMLRNLLTST